MRKAIILIALPVLALGACGIGKQKALDEFAVARNAPLVIPPDFALTPPVASGRVAPAWAGRFPVVVVLVVLVVEAVEVVVLSGGAGVLGGGAGDENRTRVASLEDWGSTIELHPQGCWTRT